MKWSLIKYIVNTFFLVTLTYFSYRDIFERALKRNALLGCAAISLLLSIFCIFYSPLPFVYGVSVGISVLFGIGFAFLAKKAKLIKAGDREGILSYAFLSPFLLYPFSPKAYLLFSPIPLFLFDLMSNLVMLLILVPLFTGIYNVIKYVNQKNPYQTLASYPWYPLTLFIGIPKPVETLQTKDSNKYIVLEERLLDGWQINYHFQLDQKQAKMNKEIVKSANKVGKNFLFIQPTLPLYPFLLLSVLVFILFGNIPLFLFHLLNLNGAGFSPSLGMIVGGGILLVILASIKLLQTFKKK